MEVEERKIIKYTEGTLSDSELSDLNAWRKKSGNNKKLYSGILPLRILNRYNSYNNASEVEKAFERFEKATKRKARRAFFITFSKYAAIILLAVSFITYNYFRIDNNQYSTFVCDDGENVKRIELADNSVVWLHKNSELKVPVNFSESSRTLLLKGRAFFDVTKDAEHPFEVTAGDAVVKVLGTSFDLLAYENTNTVEAILVSGSIVLQDFNHRDVIQIKPGEKVSYNTDERTFDLDLVDVNVLTAWRLDQLVFENETLAQIVEGLNLLYKVNIFIKSEELANKKFRFVVNKDEPLDDVLNNINYLNGMHVVKNKDEIYIYKQ